MEWDLTCLGGGVQDLLAEERLCRRGVMRLVVGAWPVAQVPGLAGGVGRAAKAINAGQPCSTTEDCWRPCHAASLVLHCLQATAHFCLSSAHAGMGTAYAGAVIDYLLKKSAAWGLLAVAQTSCGIRHEWARHRFANAAAELQGNKA